MLVADIFHKNFRCFSSEIVENTSKRLGVSGFMGKDCRMEKTETKTTKTEHNESKEVRTREGKRRNGKKQERGCQRRRRETD